MREALTSSFSVFFQLFSAIVRSRRLKKEKQRVEHSVFSIRLLISLLKQLFNKVSPEEFTSVIISKSNSETILFSNMAHLKRSSSSTSWWDVLLLSAWFLLFYCFTVLFLRIRRKRITACYNQSETHTDPFSFFVVPHFPFCRMTVCSLGRRAA